MDQFYAICSDRLEPAIDANFNLLRAKHKLGDEGEDEDEDELQTDSVGVATINVDLCHYIMVYFFKRGTVHCGTCS